MKNKPIKTVLLENHPTANWILEVAKNHFHNLQVHGCNFSKNLVSNPLPVGAVVLPNVVVLKLCWTGIGQIE